MLIAIRFATKADTTASPKVGARKCYTSLLKARTFHDRHAFVTQAMYPVRLINAHSTVWSGGVWGTVASTRACVFVMSGVCIYSGKRLLVRLAEVCL